MLQYITFLLLCVQNLFLQKIEQATGLLAELKTAVNFIPILDEQSVQKISDLKETLAKLTLPVQYLKGVGPKMAQRFGAKKINNVEDLLLFLPRIYEDRREIKKINRLETGKNQTVMGKVILTEYKYYGKRRILEITISDNTTNHGTSQIVIASTRIRIGVSCAHWNCNRASKGVGQTGC